MGLENATARLRRQRRGLSKPVALGVAIGAIVVAAAALATYFQWRADRQIHVVRLPDGVEVIYRGHARVEPDADYARTKAVSIDGDALVRTPANPPEATWTVKTRLLQLTVTGPTQLRVTANWEETGEQAEVLRGHVVARKAYPSHETAPDTLLDGDMVLINRTIDLMEKEHTDPPVLQAWIDAITAEAAKR